MREPIGGSRVGLDSKGGASGGSTGPGQANPRTSTLLPVECQRCGQTTPAAGSRDWDDWEPSHESGWLCFPCMVEEVKDKADRAFLLTFEDEMQGHWLPDL